MKIQSYDGKKIDSEWDRTAYVRFIQYDSIIDVIKNVKKFKEVVRNLMEQGSLFFKTVSLLFEAKLKHFEGESHSFDF